MINRPNAEIWTLRHLFRVAVCVLLVACFGAVSAQGESAYADEGRWSRLAGSDAYGTMQAIVQSEWQASDAVVIATFDGYWDALSASALAGVLDAPALFTDRYGLSEATRSEIERLGATHAYVCGGVNAVSDTVVAELDDMGLQVERLAGAKAPDTAVAIAAKAAELAGGASGLDAHTAASDANSSQAQPAIAPLSSTCIVATDSGYWDALAASPYAYAKQSPIFLATDGKLLSETTLAAIKDGGFSRAIVAGGPVAVDDAVMKQLENTGMEVQRVYGETACDTSFALAEFAVGEGLSYEHLGLVTADGYWDALSGGALCGRTGSPLVLVDNENLAIARGYLAGNKQGVSAGRVFGGEAAVWANVLAQIEEVTDPDWDGCFGSAQRKALDLSEDYRASFVHGEKPGAYQKYIVLHDTEGEGTAAGVVDWWDSNGAGVAAHFVVNKDGSVVQCVPLDKIAHHAGYGDTGHNEYYGVTDESRDDKVGTVPIGPWSADYGMNSYSVGIEMIHVGGSGYYPEEQLDAVDKLIAYIDAYYGFESEIIDHKAWRTGNSDTSPEFADYLVNYQRYRTHG